MTSAVDALCCRPTIESRALQVAQADISLRGLSEETRQLSRLRL